MNASASRGLASLLAGLAMFGPFSIDTMFPAFQAMEREFGVSPLAMQQTLTAYLLAYACMSLFHGALSDSYGRRKVILAGVGVFTLASVGCALATSLPMLILWRIVQGLSAGAGLIVGRAIIRDLFAGPAAQKLMSQVSLMFGIAPAVAPIIGGWVLLAGSWRWIFWFLAAWAGLLFLLCHLRLPETHPREKRLPFRPRPLIEGYSTMLRDDHFWPLAIAGTTAFSAIFVYISSAPVVVLELLHLSEQQFAWLFVPVVSGMMTGAFLSGRLAGRASASSTVAAGFAIMLFGCVLNIVAAFVLAQPQVPWSVLPLGVYGVGMSLAFPTLTLLLLDRFPRYRGGVASLQASVSLVFNAVLAGVIVVHFAHDAHKLALASTVLALTGLIAWRIYRGRAKRELARERSAPPETATEEAEPF